MKIRRTITGRRCLAAGSLGAIAAIAQAGPPVALDSAVFVERVKPGNVRSLEPASRLNRGDRIITVVTWRRDTGKDTGGFTVTNPVPRSVAYQGSARDGEAVSVDGGRTWGQLGQLRIDGRLANPEDVTHVRWRIASGSSGRIAYAAIVR